MQDGCEAQLRPAGWSDLFTIMRLMAEGSANGHFSPRLREPRVRLGLALQLAGVVALGRLYSPQRARCAASLQVLRAGRRCLGFSLLVWLPDPVSPSGRVQITLFNVAGQAQASGLGTRMLRGVLAQLPAGCAVQADCLPASQAMQRLLRRQGFRQVPSEAAAAVRWQRMVP